MGYRVVSSPFPQPAGWFFLVLLQQELFPSQLEKCCVTGRNTSSVLLTEGLSHSSCEAFQDTGTSIFLVQWADRFISNTDAWMWWVNLNFQQMELLPSKFFSSSIDLSSENWRKQWCQCSLTYIKRAKQTWNSKKKVWTSCSVPLSYSKFFHVFLKETQHQGQLSFCQCVINHTSKSVSLFRKEPFCIHRIRIIRWGVMAESVYRIFLCHLFVFPRECDQEILFSFISWIMLLNQPIKLCILKGCYKNCGSLKMGFSGLTMK